MYIVNKHGRDVRAPFFASDSAAVGSVTSHRDTAINQRVTSAGRERRPLAISGPTLGRQIVPAIEITRCP